MGGNMEKRSFKKSNEMRERAERVIPGGGHTYSKGPDQFPLESPYGITRGYGCTLVDADNNEFLDLGLSLGTIVLGHGFEPVTEAVIAEVKRGVNFTRPS